MYQLPFLPELQSPAYAVPREGRPCRNGHCIRQYIGQSQPENGFAHLGRVYPAWHPTEKLIAYSVNQTGQTFHTRDLQKVEVQDMLSDLILYDVEKNEVTRIPGDADELEVFPWWSPDGKYLYYASARFVRKDTAENLDNETILRYKEIKYNLFRRNFDPASRRIGPSELVFDAAARGKSATLPRISPDGHYLMFTLGEFGVFHIWHKDADL